MFCSLQRYTGMLNVTVAPHIVSSRKELERCVPSPVAAIVAFTNMGSSKTHVSLVGKGLME